MSRNISAGIISELTASAVRVEYLFETDLADTGLYLWTGTGDLSWSGKTWQGNGWLQNLGPMQETGSVQAVSAEVTLSGIPATLISLALQAKQSKSGTIYLAFLDSDDAIIDVDTRFKGYLDAVKISEQAATSSITLAFESELIRLRVPRERRWTDADQKNDYPADRGFEYVTFLQEQRLFWGKPDSTRS